MTEQLRFLADEMLGRLVRYLRMMGYDTEYGKGLADAELQRRAAEQHRVLLTRDRSLAHAVANSVLLRSDVVLNQLRELRSALPELTLKLRPDRCTACNAPLHPRLAPPSGGWPEYLPAARLNAGLTVFECTSCGRFYWEGSHTESLRRTLDRLVEPTEK